MLALLALVLSFGLAPQSLVSLGLTASAQAQEIAPPTPKTPEPVVPVLTNPVTGYLEAGKLIVTVGTTRRFKDGPAVNFGYRTGQLVPVTVVISADPDVVVDLGALANKTLSKDGSDFEMAAPPVVTTMEKHGKKITVLQVMVRTWVLDPVVTLNFQFHYATGLLPDKKTPAWKVGTTPDFLISSSRTATESSKQLLDGDVSVKTTATSGFVSVLKYTGVLLLLGVAFWCGQRVWTEWRRANRLTEAQRAWETFERVMRERETTGGAFTAHHLEALGASLRRYLTIETVTTDKVRDPLDKFFATHPQRDELVTVCFSALAKLDRAIYGKVNLTREEEDALIDEIVRVVPRD